MLYNREDFLIIIYLGVLIVEYIYNKYNAPLPPLILCFVGCVTHDLEVVDVVIDVCVRT